MDNIVLDSDGPGIRLRPFYGRFRIVYGSLNQYIRWDKAEMSKRWHVRSSVDGTGRSDSRNSNIEKDSDPIDRKENRASHGG
jgi:hypothetical protein